MYDQECITSKHNHSGEQNTGEWKKQKCNMHSLQSNRRWYNQGKNVAVKMTKQQGSIMVAMCVVFQPNWTLTSNRC